MKGIVLYAVKDSESLGIMWIIDLGLECGMSFLIPDRCYEW